MRVHFFFICWRAHGLFRGWKVASFVLGLVFSQSLTHIVSIANLMPYLMDVLEEKLPIAAATANIRMSVTAIMAIFGAYLSDAYIGRYRLILYSTIVYVTLSYNLILCASSRMNPFTKGLSLLTLSASQLLSKTRNAYLSSERVSVFRVALLLVALGKAGYTPMLKAFGADQLKSNREDEDDKVKNRVNCWWCIGVNFGAFAGILLLVIVEGKQAWIVGYGVLALNMLVAFCVFISGKHLYERVEPRGSILTRASRVLVAAVLKRHLDFPVDASQLYQGESNQLPHTDGLRFLEKAAIIQSLSPNREEQANNWRRLCTVMEVEETKLLLRMFPMWTAFLNYGLVKSLGTSFFLQQGSNMNRELNRTKVPLPFLLIFSRYVSGQIIWLNKRWKRSFPELEQVITPTRRIGIGLVFCALCCTVASLVEAIRLDVVRQHGLLDRPKVTLPMSVFWLTPQFLMLGAMDGFTYPGIKDFFYDQVPKSMWDFGASFSASVVGVGSLLGVIVIAASDKASGQGERPSWFADTINRSRLDYFYQTLTVLSTINLVYYGFVATRYTYKKAVVEDEPPDATTADIMSF